MRNDSAACLNNSVFFPFSFLLYIFSLAPCARYHIFFTQKCIIFSFAFWFYKSTHWKSHLFMIRSVGGRFAAAYSFSFDFFDIIHHIISVCMNDISLHRFGVVSTFLTEIRQSSKTYYILRIIQNIFCLFRWRDLNIPAVNTYTLYKITRAWEKPRHVLASQSTNQPVSNSISCKAIMVRERNSMNERDRTRIRQVKIKSTTKKRSLLFIFLLFVLFS